MKIGILGDLHYGVRNDLKLFHDHFETYFDYFFEELEKNDIKLIVQLGDLWDRRKYINFNTLQSARRCFFDKLKRHDINMITLLGNHDLFLRESTKISSSDLLLNDYKNIEVCTNPKSFSVENTTFDVIPWVCKENEEDVLDFIRKSKSDLCFGHFDFIGFPMYRGINSQGGTDANIFVKYELVCSGHYHTQSKKDNVVYVGTPYELTWQDYNDPKGFHVFDTKDRVLTFHENHMKYFVRVEYDDTKELINLDSLTLENCFIKVIVLNKTNPIKFEKFISDLYSRGCYEIKIIEDLSEFSTGSIEDDINLEDTMDILSKYIESIETDVDKEKIKMFVKSLYIEAVNVGVV
jgi:DNA repair exonuclease SbcCD nuclease subunit